MGAPSSKTYYLVGLNFDVSRLTTFPSSASVSVFDNEVAALDYANRNTSSTGGYKTTIAVATKLVAPKPVEMVETDLAAC